MMKLFKNDQGWMARTDDPEVIELFGADILPLPYTLEADPEMVLSEIQALNPAERVELR